ncbi:helix-turn-helix transcriptional regulator [Nonomuraea gerenzanensis]|uniref:helix-turn-helix transcriptional regulator n=1 Tax=Nonomuraea gerenzanensis TaxID=93944 RepID=UPI001CDA40E9|nr:LuxR C-terminal-related transcriptional regulator [Nonomuraea gerenzanensis]UBU09532.1 LuxR C-terminal-related transcriptional regulator [Nonomuraea gerenzanensis]
MTGPPGTGKTMAAISWATCGAAPGPIAWVTLQRGAERPEVFWPMVLSAFRRAGVAVSGDGDPVAALALHLTERAQPVVLVLDDLSLPADCEVNRDLGRLLRDTHAWLRLVVTARQDPPLPMRRYHLAQELTEVGVEQLAFSERETEQLLAQHKVSLSQASLRTLLARTEGWAAGLRLAAISLEGHPAPDEFVAHFAGDDNSVVAYLMEEVLDAEPEDRRRLLLATSVPERINAELATELAGPVAGRAFAAMVRDNAFAMRLDQGWYRFHPMFADALRLILRHEAPGHLAELDLRAASWFARTGDVHDAVWHAARAGAWPYAARLVVDHLEIGRLLGLRPDHVLGESLRAMPECAPQPEGAPEQAVVTAAMARAGGDEETCAAALDTASALIGRSPAAASPALRLAIGLVRLADPQPRDPDLSRNLTEVEGLLQETPAHSLDQHPEVEALVLAARGSLELRQGRLHEAVAALRAAIEPATRAGGECLYRQCLGQLALAEGLRGRPARACELAAQAEQLPEAGPAGRRGAASHLASAWVALQKVEPARAKQELARAHAAVRQCPDAVMAGLHALVGAQAKLLEGLPRQALEETRQVTQGPQWLRRRLLLLQSEAHALLGETAEARACAERAGDADDLRKPLALALAALSAGRPEEAVRAVHAVLAEPGLVPVDVRLDALLLDARLAYQGGDPSRGRRMLDRALRLGDREQALMPFARSKPWLQPLLRHDPYLVRPYLRFLARLRLTPESGEERLDATLYGRLSARELDVLQHLSKVMTTEEIAAQMYVSVNTVKTHLKSIYRKLAVTRRAEAVRRAKHLSLV